MRTTELRETTFADVESVFKHGRPYDQLKVDAEALERVREAAICRTIVINGQPAAIFGGSKPDHLGLMHVWACVTDVARGHGKFLTSMALGMIEHSMVAFSVKNMFSWSPEKAPENARWLGTLGFKRCPVLDYVDEHKYRWEGYER
jgi:hypothetical protein